MEIEIIIHESNLLNTLSFIKELVKTFNFKKPNGKFSIKREDYMNKKNLEQIQFLLIPEIAFEIRGGNIKFYTASPIYKMLHKQYTNSSENFISLTTNTIIKCGRVDLRILKSNEFNSSILNHKYSHYQNQTFTVLNSLYLE